MHEACTEKKWHRLHMNEEAIFTSAEYDWDIHSEHQVEHDWGSHIRCNFDRMFVGAIWSGSWSELQCVELRGK